ncbi:MAG TPA: tetratricopeptide repeat protein [Candidatus Binatia bacterium]
MATSAKHFSRKELRQPDNFVLFTQRVLGFVQQNRRVLILAGAVLTAVIIGISIWQVYKSRQNEQAAQHFATALGLFRENKHNEAIPEFEKVEAYRWSHYAALAHLYEANSHLATNDPDQAAAAAQRFIAATDQNSVYRQIGLMTLGHIQELKNQCSEAIQRYTEAERIAGVLRESAVLGKARCYTTIGDNKSSIAAYQQYIKENPNSPIAARLMLQVAELQTKTETEPAVK